MYAKNQLQLVFQQSWTGLLKDWLQLVATSSVASCQVLRNLATSPVASCLKFGQKDWTGLDFKTLHARHRLVGHLRLGGQYE